MNHLLELHKRYLDDLQQLKEQYEGEQDALYYCMKEFVSTYEKERELKGKIQSLERELTNKFSEEYANDR